MQYMLIAITVVSVLVAVAMCAIVVKMLREERRRSDARVEALLAMAGESPVEAPEPRPVDSAASRSPLDHRDRPARFAGSEREFSRPALHQDDPELHPAAPAIGVSGLFAERETASPWGRRIGAAAACAAAVVVFGLALGFWAGGAEESDAAGISAGTSSAAPLELLSLRHTSEARALTITGLVQNPRNGVALSGVSAVALLFASDGGFIGSGRAPLDFTRLEPGTESPFVVQVPSAAGVARYRVSFRGADGAVIAHLDRRGGGRVDLGRLANRPYPTGEP